MCGGATRRAANRSVALSCGVTWRGVMRGAARRRVAGRGDARRENVALSCEVTWRGVMRGAARRRDASRRVAGRGEAPQIEAVRGAALRSAGRCVELRCAARRGGA